MIYLLLKYNSEDTLYNQAVSIVTNDKRVSISYIQRKLQIGYNRAARIVERWKKKGIVSSSKYSQVKGSFYKFSFTNVSPFKNKPYYNYNIFILVLGNINSHNKKENLNTWKQTTKFYEISIILPELYAN